MPFIKCEICKKQVYICEDCNTDSEKPVINVAKPKKAKGSNIITKIAGPKYALVKSTKVTADISKLIKR